MVEISAGNILKLPQLFKPIELVVGFILLLFYLVPTCPYGMDGAAGRFADMLFIGYFFICILQIISILGGDKSEILDVLLALFGFIFFLSIGSLIIHNSRHIALGGKHCNRKGKALGSLSIIASFLYLADAAFGGFALMKS